MSKKNIATQKNIALIQNDLGLEAEVSRESAKAVAQALVQLGYKYFMASANQNLPQLLLSEKPDLAFLAVHGPYGEDGCLQSLFEFLKIPYTGSGILASSLCMDKIFFKNWLIQNKFPTPDFYVVPPTGSTKTDFAYPVVVKSSHGGSSLATYIVKEKKQVLPFVKKAKQIGSPVFIEDYLPHCREIAVSFLDGQILTPVEIEPKGEFYDYKRKYIKGKSSYFIPPRIDPLVLEKIKSLAERVFRSLPIYSYARADFLLEKDKTPWLIEVNTLPGLTKNSLLPKSAQYDGIDFPELIQKIVHLADTDYKF